MDHGKVADGGDSDKLGAIPRLEGRNQMENRSVYLSVCRGNLLFRPKGRYPLFKVDPSSASSGEKKMPRIGELRTDCIGKTFVSLPSLLGWIIGVGGKSGGTILVNTKTAPIEVIHGPNLLAAKLNPVVAVVGSKVYALTRCPSYKTEPDFVPWFEVLDLSKGTVTQAADGSVSLDGCSWEELPYPPFFPRKLTVTGYNMPPILPVRSYVVVRHYVLISLSQRTRGTYAFDTNSGEWNKIHDEPLPFYGPATPHGCVFLASSLGNGSINAYRFHVSTSNSSSSTGKGSAPLKLSITMLPIIHKGHEQVGRKTDDDKYISSLDSDHFCLLTSFPDYSKLTDYSEFFEGLSGSFSRRLIAKLTTYRIENPALLEVTHDQEKQLPALKVEHEIAVSTLQVQDFKFHSSRGFGSPAISFVLSV